MRYYKPHEQEAFAADLAVGDELIEVASESESSRPVSEVVTVVDIQPSQASNDERVVELSNGHRYRHTSSHEARLGATWFRLSMPDQSSPWSSDLYPPDHDWDATMRRRQLALSAERSFATHIMNDNISARELEHIEHTLFSILNIHRVS